MHNPPDEVDALRAVHRDCGCEDARSAEVHDRHVLAANVIATVPMLLLFALCGRYVMQGITITGNKE